MTASCCHTLAERTEEKGPITSHQTQLEPHLPREQKAPPLSRGEELKRTAGKKDIRLFIHLSSISHLTCSLSGQLAYLSPWCKFLRFNLLVMWISTLDQSCSTTVYRGGDNVCRSEWKKRGERGLEIICEDGAQPDNKSFFTSVSECQ